MYVSMSYGRMLLLQETPKIKQRRGHRQLSTEQVAVKVWMAEHRGIQTKLAKEYKCTQKFVHDIAYGRSTALPGHPVEIALRENGWPGIRPTKDWVCRWCYRTNEPSDKCWACQMPYGGL